MKTSIASKVVAICGLIAFMFTLAPQSAHAHSPQYFGAVFKNNVGIPQMIYWRENAGVWHSYYLHPGQAITFGDYIGHTCVIDVAYNNYLGRSTLSTIRLKMWVCGGPQDGWLQTLQRCGDFVHNICVSG